MRLDTTPLSNLPVITDADEQVLSNFLIDSVEGFYQLAAQTIKPLMETTRIEKRRLLGIRRAAKSHLSHEISEKLEKPLTADTLIGECYAIGEHEYKILTSYRFSTVGNFLARAAIDEDSFAEKLYCDRSASGKNLFDLLRRYVPESEYLSKTPVPGMGGL